MEKKGNTYVFDYKEEISLQCKYILILEKFRFTSTKKDLPKAYS